MKAVLFSGGIDSLVVLSMMKPIDVITLRQNFTKRQWGVVDKVIKEWDLTVFSAPPLRSYIVPNGEFLARVDEYRFGNTIVPILRDLEHSEECSLKLDNQTLDHTFHYDTIYTGCRKDDKSFALGQPMKDEVVKLNGVTFIQPIFHWSDEEVREAAKDLPYAKEYYDEGDESFATDTLLACTNCMTEAEKVYCPLEQKEIPTVKWDRDLALTNFRQRFNYADTYSEHKYH